MLDFLAGLRTRARDAPAPPGYGDADGAARSEASRGLIERLSFEATPHQIATASPARLGLPAGTEIYVPRLPGAPIEATAEACARLVSERMTPVAHLTARSLASRGELDSALGRLGQAGAAALLLVAGDVERPAGPFRDTRDVLATGLIARHGFAGVGFAGHPEGLRHADETALERAIADKIAWSGETGARIWLVTQFAFAAAPVLAWMERLRARGLAVPVRVGLPGPATLTKLLAYARQCGAGPSARLLTARPDAARLVGGWRPDAMVADLAAARWADPGLPLDGVHVYAFGGLAATAAWREEALRTPMRAGPAADRLRRAETADDAASRA